MMCGVSLQLWQGYGGNIYFDAVRCQSMRINSAKSGRSRKQDISKRWKSKSCTPLKRGDERQTHTTSIASEPTGVPTASIHNLGSLRVRSCKEKTCRIGNCRHKDTTSHSPGKICKGFSEKLITETFQKFQEDRSKILAKEPLTVSGGHVGDSGLDPIDKVQQFNTQYGFPAVLSDSPFFSHPGGKKNSYFVSGDGDPFIKLPVLGRHEEKQTKSKSGAASSDEGSKPSNEPRPVFIIPFGAFDDPVDSELDLKRKVEKKEKVSARNAGDGPDLSLVSKKETRNHPGGSESSSFAAAESCNVERTGCVDQNDNTVKHSVPAPDAMGLEKSLKRGVPDFHLKREISNLSLSNYLRAVPSRGPKEQNRLTPPQSGRRMMPKMSYTKRSPALSTFYMVNNSLHHIHHSGLNQGTNGSQGYGGYYPSTGRKESKTFYAEISTCSEAGSSLSSRGGTQDASRRSKSSGNNRTNSTSPRISKHALLKASYASRNSFTRQSRERSPRGFEATSNSGKNVLPVTGQQISRLSGVHDR